MQAFLVSFIILMTFSGCKSTNRSSVVKEDLNDAVGGILCSSPEQHELATTPNDMGPTLVAQEKKTGITTYDVNIYIRDWVPGNAFKASLAKKNAAGSDWIDFPVSDKVIQAQGNIGPKRSHLKLLNSRGQVAVLDIGFFNPRDQDPVSRGGALVGSGSENRNSNAPTTPAGKSAESGYEYIELGDFADGVLTLDRIPIKLECRTYTASPA